MDKNSNGRQNDADSDPTQTKSLSNQLANLERLIAQRNDNLLDSVTRLRLLEDKVDRILDIVEGPDKPPLLTSINSLEKDVDRLRDSVGWLRRIVYGVTAFLLVTLLEIFREAYITPH